MNDFWKQSWKYVVAIGAIAVVAGLGTLFVSLGFEWFSSLDKPTEFIPSAVIPIVWTVIYSLFAIVLCLWLKKENLPIKTLVLLVLNGAFNVLWCLLFFTLNSTLLGLLAIVINLILAFLLIANIYKNFPLGAYLTAIYPVWLCFATCLNLSTWILN